MFAIAICALVIGTALLVLECFVPGIGVAGITGGILCLLGIFGLVPYIGWYVIFVINYSAFQHIYVCELCRKRKKSFGAFPENR